MYMCIVYINVYNVYTLVNSNFSKFNVEKMLLRYNSKLKTILQSYYKKAIDKNKQGTFGT